MLELLDRWLTSLELHLKYVDLPDADYFAVQPWPKHDRPTRWILELARQKTQELRAHQESRVAMGDRKFADSLELMGFLSNLVGSQHVQRFIPLAEPDKEQEISRPAAKPQPSAASKANGHAKPAAPANHDLDATREMPRVVAPQAAPSRTLTEPAPVAKPVAPKPAPKVARKAPATAAAAAKTTASPDAVQKKVMADAVRLLKWGKEWHELVDLVARIADRPPAAEIRRILRSHKAEIEMQAEGDE
ncbi:MAG: hypothetical protein ABL896_13540 [Hylemonella sp.]